MHTERDCCRYAIRWILKLREAMYQDDRTPAADRKILLTKAWIAFNELDGLIKILDMKKYRRQSKK